MIGTTEISVHSRPESVPVSAGRGENMQFISYSFFILFPFVVLAYYLFPGKMRPAWLLASGLFLHIWTEPQHAVRNLAVLLSIGAVMYGAGILLSRTAENSGESSGALPPEGEIQRKRKRILVCSLLYIIGSLVVWKYARMAFPASRSLTAPLGISFYALAAAGYVIDCYRDSSRVEKNPLYCFLFVSFFPLTLSGPIERGRNLIPQFAEPVPFSADRTCEGLSMMLWGFFLKLVLADRMALLVDPVYADPDAFGGALVLLSIFFYALEIYCDFYGYSCIARGASLILGIRVMENFECPYFSSSIALFWRRWHMSLSSWFRDYIYIPLGGSRRGAAVKYRNILIVFAVSGLWHGTGLTFLIWGLLHGIFQIVEASLMPTRHKFNDISGILEKSLSHRLLKVIFTFCLTAFAWVFFRAPGLKDVFRIFMELLHPTLYRLTDGTLSGLGLDMPNMVLLLLGLAILIMADSFKFRGFCMRRKIMSQGPWMRWLIYIGGVVLVAVCGIWGAGYSASSFIYSQF